MAKILFISNIGGRKVGNFSLASIAAAKRIGLEFHNASNWKNSSVQQMVEDEKQHGVSIHHIDFNRNPFHPSNFKAYKQLLQLMKKEKFDIVHCNTPVGGVIGRACAKRLGIKKVIYMAHGFHFFKGAPKKNWIFYYPAERLLAYWTDKLVTINQEDYKRAKKFNLRNNGKVYYIPGVGLDVNKFSKIEVDKYKKRLELDIPSEAIIVLSVGELNNNKNHEVILRSVAKLNNKNVHYCIAGKGELAEHLEALSRELGVSDRFHLLGFRNDVIELCKVADIFAFPSKREGLGIAALEAMSTGLPIITSNVHGIVDYSKNDLTGFTCDPNDIDGFTKSLNRLIDDPELRHKMGNNNKKVASKFDSLYVVNKMEKIYRSIVNG